MSLNNTNLKLKLFVSGGFGGTPAFGSSPAFGSPTAAFGGAPTFGSTSPFGQAATAASGASRGLFGSGDSGATQSAGFAK